MCFGETEFCDKTKIKDCLNPVENYLVKKNMAKTSKSLFQTAIEHFLLVLDDPQDEFIHVSSLNTVLKKIDDAFLHPSDLDDACG